MKHRNFSQKLCSFFVAVILLSVLMLFHSTNPAHAESNEIDMTGVVYELEKDGSYEFSKSYISAETADAKNSFGKLSISGNIASNGKMNGIPAYMLKSGNALFSYSFNQDRLFVDDAKWSIISDKSKTIDTIKIDENIQNGVLILQTSLDGENWVREAVLTNIFTEDTPLTEAFYSSLDVQIQNGCYFQIIVAYRLRLRLDDKKVLFVDVEDFDYKKIAEVYEFYAKGEDLTTSPNDTPAKNLGSKIKTKKDSGFSGEIALKENDPHYGWDIGQFFINGYTRETKDVNGNPIFLKNVGDKATLWFKLQQDINRLNGNSSLAISSDTNGYDQYFETSKTDFKRGALIISFTDHQGVRHDPIIYTNFLEANTRTGADTRVQLFEEGDYEVALNYEIKKNPRQVGSISIVPTYTNYRIYFKYSIRNGNCMVFPFDLLTGAQLSNEAITGNGFKLDMAKSRYLTIDVSRSIFNTNSDGTRVEDILFNRPAKDGEEYKEDGKYVFNVRNLYTGENTTKTIFVGEDVFFKTLSLSGLSLAQINDQIAAGAEIAADGSLVFPAAPDITDHLDPGPDSNPNQESAPSSIVSNKGIEEKASNPSALLFVLGGLAILVSGAIAIVIVVMRKKN